MVKKKVFSIGNALSRGLEETIQSAQQYSSELRMDVIPLKKIELDPDNPRHMVFNITDAEYGINDADVEKTRKIYERESLQSIANSIQLHGLIHPITVYKQGEYYRLIAGERRTLAAILAGKTDIQAKILDDKPDRLKISLLQWIENIERSDLSLWERLCNLEKIVSAHTQLKGVQTNQMTITELSHLIGCVKSQAITYKAILEADNELKQLIFENKIKSLEKAALISAIQSNEVRRSAIEACIAGATLKQLKNMIDKYNKKTISIKKIDQRGRQTTSIKFGVTKNINVAKMIIESILKHPILNHGDPLPKDIDWNNHRSVSEIFKQLLKTLEALQV